MQLRSHQQLPETSPSLPSRTRTEPHRLSPVPPGRARPAVSDSWLPSRAHRTRQSPVFTPGEVQSRTKPACLQVLTVLLKPFVPVSVANVPLAGGRCHGRDAAQCQGSHVPSRALSTLGKLPQNSHWTGVGVGTSRLDKALAPRTDFIPFWLSLLDIRN